MKLNRITLAATAVVLLILGMAFNPMSYNEAGNRTVVTRQSGFQFVKYEAGLFYAGFFAHETEWPNQISVAYNKAERSDELEDNLIEIGTVQIQFGVDATKANVNGITQYILPTDEKEMIEMHNTHKTPESLVKRRLEPYTRECLQSSAQLMSSEMHYGGGRAQMAQDYLDQLKNGVYLLKTSEQNVYDSIEHVYKRTYQTAMLYDKTGSVKRKFSSIKEYGITVADAQITNVVYEEAVQKMLQKKIAAATGASVAKQELMTAQQRALTAKAQGEQKLVEIEYAQRQEQTKQVVAAQTKVEVAKQDMEQQRIQAQAAELEAKKVKTLADAEAYAKQRVMLADGALDKKLAAYKEVQGYWADALKGYQGAIVPQIVSGNSSNGGNGAMNFMEIMSAKAQRDLMLDLKSK